MTRRAKIALAVLVLFSLVNVGGTVVAAAAGEPFHTAVHAVLLLAGVYLTWRIAQKRVARY